MSMTTLRLMQQQYAREDDMLDAAIAAFTVKTLKPFSQFQVTSVGLEKGKVTIAGSWGDWREDRATMTIDSKTGKGSIHAQRWFGTTGGDAEGPLNVADRKVLVSAAHKLVDDGVVAASSATRAAIAVLKAKR
jgi:hypothetical protein